MALSVRAAGQADKNRTSYDFLPTACYVHLAGGMAESMHRCHSETRVPGNVLGCAACLHTLYAAELSVGPCLDGMLQGVGPGDARVQMC